MQSDCAGPVSIVVIVGTSLARAQAAEALLEEGREARILFSSVEEERLYGWPPLSKDYMRGDSPRENVYVHEDDFHAESELALGTGTAATGIDAGSRERRRLRPGEVFAALVATTGLIALAFSIGAAAADLTIPAALVMLGVLIGGVVTLGYWLFPTTGKATGILVRSGGAPRRREAMLEGGGWTGFDHLAPATRVEPRCLDLPGSDLEGR